LRCTKRKKKCSQKCIRREELEAQIDEILDSIEIPEDFVKWAIKQLEKESKTDTNAFAAKRTQLKKEYESNEVMSENLVDKLMRNVITEELYQATVKRYEEKQRQIEKSLKKYGRMKVDWLKKLEEDFSFASTARKRFAEGDINTKREVFFKLGSNFSLKDGKLFIELRKPYFAIQKSKKEVQPIFSRFELSADRMTMRKNDASTSQIPIWYTLPDRLRTIYKFLNGYQEKIQVIYA